MSVKERFENHPVIFGGMLLILGFGAGYKVYPELHPEKHTDLKKPSVKVEKVRELVGCEISGFETLERNHHSRLAALQTKLINVETEATDRNNSVYKYDYLESAERLRDDINNENKNYESQIDTLRTKCSTAVSDIAQNEQT